MATYNTSRFFNLFFNEDNINKVVDHSGFRSVFNYDNKFINTFVRLFIEFIPKYREFTDFNGKLQRRRIVPENFKVLSVTNKSIDTGKVEVTNIYLCSQEVREDEAIYNYGVRIEFVPDSDYIYIYKKNKVSFTHFDKETLIQEVPTRIF